MRIFFLSILVISLTSLSFSQDKIVDTIFLDMVYLNDSTNLNEKYVIEPNVEKWDELFFHLELVNKTKTPIILTRISTYDGGLIPYSLMNSREPIMPEKSVLIYYKYHRPSGGSFSKYLNFTFNSYSEGEFIRKRFVGNIIYKQP